MFDYKIQKVMIICCLLFIYIHATGVASGINVNFQDQTSPRSNTLFDDADDIQKQLDNEARDRIKFARPKTIWVFHFPTHLPINHFFLDKEYRVERKPRDLTHNHPSQPYEIFVTAPLNFFHADWDYGSQDIWSKTYPECGGRSQSPVDLPIQGLIKTRGARPLLFKNCEITPKSMTLMNDGKRVMLFGEWPLYKRPLVYGGAAHTRRYLFHSITLHSPSEHTVGSLQYPLETQLLFLSAEYKDIDHALNASILDSQAFLGITSLYKYGNHDHKGVSDILDIAKNTDFSNKSVIPKPIDYFSPPLKEYACYHGSLTTPPCKESVIWLVRARTLPITRKTAELARALLTPQEKPSHLNVRTPQPLNDRKVFLFK